jgi:hypothetical protein
MCLYLFQLLELAVDWNDQLVKHGGNWVLLEKHDGKRGIGKSCDLTDSGEKLIVLDREKHVELSECEFYPKSMYTFDSMPNMALGGTLRFVVLHEDF